MSDPFDDLDDAVASIEGVCEKIEADRRAKQAAEAVEDCRFKAVGQRSAAQAFFTNLALGLQARADASVETMATDGKALLFNPEWTLGLSDAERYGVVIGHEPMHCAMEHFARVLGMDDSDCWQQAADLEINPICKEAGFRLPSCAIFPGGKGYENCLPGKTMEEYYAILVGNKPPKQPGNPGPGPGPEEFTGDPGGCGGVLPAPDRATADARSAKWQGNVAAAAQQAAQRGDLPGSLQRWVDRILKPKVDPWEVLREYMTRIAKSEQSWARINRRHLPRGLYLPSRHSQALGDVVLLVDTSGSIGDDQLAMMAGFLEGVLAANPGKLTILYHTTSVYNTEEWVPEDGPLELKNTESGGTSHIDAFERIAEMGLEPAVIVALTDLESSFPDDPGIPTIWVDVEGGHEPPFGQYVSIA